MRKMITIAGLCLMLATGAAFAQTGGTGSATGTGPSSDANTGSNTQNPVSPRSNLPGGSSGITTQSTTPASPTPGAASSKPSESQCRQGWAPDMPWTRAEFESLCR